MGDIKNLPKHEQVPNQDPPPQYVATGQIPLQGVPPLPMNATHVITVPSQTPIFRTPQDEAYMSSIRNKAIVSLVLSIVASICVYPLLCTIPAIILAILALVERTNLGTADSYAKAAVVLTIVSSIFGAILVVLTCVLMFADTQYYRESSY